MRFERYGVSRTTALAILVIILLIAAVAGWVRSAPVIEQTKTVRETITTTVGAQVVTETQMVTKTETVRETVVSTTTVTEAPKPPTPIKLRMSSLAFPSYMLILQKIIEDKRYDLQNGLDIEWVPQTTIAGFYSTILTGEADAIPGGGPLTFQKMRVEQGAPIKVVNTLATMTLSVVAADPKIKTFEDLKGKKLAVDVGATDFLILKAYAKTVGIDIEKDVTLVPATYPIARGHLLAGEADAAVLVEPHISLAKSENPDVHVVLVFDDAWKAVTGQPFGIYLVTAIREDYLNQKPEVVERLIKTFQQVEDFLRRNPDEADAILSKGMKIPPGIMREAIIYGRIDFRVHEAWRSDILDNLMITFQFGVDTGFVPRMPPAGFIYTP